MSFLSALFPPSAESKRMHEELRRNQLMRKGVRMDALPPPAPPRVRRFTVATPAVVEHALRLQDRCLLYRLPREIRRQIFELVLGHRNIFLSLHHLA